MSKASLDDLNFDIIQRLDGNYDGDILGLRDQAIKAFYYYALGHHCIFLYIKEFHLLDCLYSSKFLRRKPYVRNTKSEERHVCIQISLSDTNHMSAVAEMKKKII